MKQYVPRSQPVQARPQASQWLPPEQRDTAWWIFHKLFRCRVQRIQTLSIEEMRMVGTPTSGDPDFDRQMINERVDRMLSIAQMVGYWQEGVTVGVADEKDTAEIYELITRHLLAWKHKLDTEFNTRNAPLEDLAKLDEFANVVYRHARHHFPKDCVDSILARKISNAGRALRGSILKSPALTTINRDPDTGQTGSAWPARVSLAQAFTQGRLPTSASLRWK